MNVKHESGHDLAQALENADLIFDRRTLEREIARMAVKIRSDYAGSRPVYLTIMHGGMPFAAQLAMELGDRKSVV